MKTKAGNPKMLAIRIDYEVGRRLKAVCALRGRTVRDAMEEFARAYVDHADELPPPSASAAARLAALTQAVAAAETRRGTKKKAT